MKRPQSKLAVISLFSILVLLICVFFLRGNRNTVTPVVIQKPESTGSNEKGKIAPVVQTPPASSPTAAASASGGGGGAVTSGVNGRRIEENVSLTSLKRWIKQREGKDVAIVDAREINDMDGKPVSMNVLVTTRLDGLTAEKLKEQLDASAVRERELREKLQKSYQEGDIAAVNKLVEEFTESRTAFVTTNEITFYKISLSKERPPVLAFWPGLPFETVREEAARSLAATKLGGDIGLQGLVHYTSAAALLCFTNKVGSSIYIDPFRVAEISRNFLQSPRVRAARADDNGRNERIASQWTEFLHP